MYEKSGSVSLAHAGPDLRLLDGIAAWCGGLHGSMSLSDALMALAQAFGAEAAAISRRPVGRHLPRVEKERLKVIALFDESYSAESVQCFRRPYCRDVIGYLFPTAQSATIWFLGDFLTDPKWMSTRGLENWRLSRVIDEIVVVSLASDSQNRDFIEFHFARPLAYSERLEIERLVPTLVRAWAGRKKGIVTQAQMDERMVHARAAADASRLQPDAAILGMSNPARLSRAEFRVFLLVSRGLSIRGVTEELALTEATMRSHLRSIYSKTGVSGLPELVYRIMSSSPEAVERGIAVR